MIISNTDATILDKDTVLKEWIVPLQLQLIEQAQELAKLRQEMHQAIYDRVKAELGEKLDMINSALTESILHKELLIEMGYFSRQEVNDKYEELKTKARPTLNG